MSAPQKHSSHFDAVAGQYDQTLPTHVRDHYLKRRVALIGAFAKKGILLDVGCGTGVLAASLSRQGIQAFGVDDSLEMMKASRVEPKPLFAQGLSSQLPYRDGSFDAVVTVATLHHLMTREAVSATIREIVRVTRPGGVVVLWDHNPNNPYWPILMRKLPQDAGGYRMVSLGEILGTVRQLSSVSKIQVIRTGIIPDFLPRSLLSLAALLERGLEQMPFVRKVLAHNVVVLSVSG